MASPRHSIWWWIFCAPGAGLLWFQYMNPQSVRDSFGTARRRNVVLFQFMSTIAIYGIIIFLLTHPSVLGVFLLPLRAIF